MTGNSILRVSHLAEVSPDDQRLIALALRIAIEQFTFDGRRVPSLAEQFQRQTRQAKRLLDQIEDADQLIVGKGTNR